MLLARLPVAASCWLLCPACATCRDSRPAPERRASAASEKPLFAAADAERVSLRAGLRVAAPAAAGVAGLPLEARVGLHPWMPPDPGLPKLPGLVADETGVMPSSSFSAGRAVSRVCRFLRYTVKPMASAAAQHAQQGRAAV